MFRNTVKKSEIDEIDINKEIDILSASSKNDAYNLSVIVLASAQHADNIHYNKAITSFLNILNDLPDNSFKSWMLGRAVLAATLIHDPVTFEQCLPKLKTLLLSLEIDNQSSWAWGYLAAINVAEYQSAKTHMMHAVSVLSDSFDQLKQQIISVNNMEQTTVSDNSTKLQQALSDLLWSYVMCAQAAARANDNEAYHNIFASMMRVTEQHTMRDVMVCVLEADWRAWAVGMIRLSAAMIHDTDCYNQLGQLHNVSMQSARLSDSKANALLSYLCEQEAGKIVNNITSTVSFRKTS